MATASNLRSKTPALEWVAAGTGLILLALLLVVVGYDALGRSEGEPAAIAIELGKPSIAANGYVVPFEAINSGGGDAADLQVEAELVDRNRVIEMSAVVIDYVPTSGRAQGGFFFSHDPAGLTIKARPLGYQSP